MTEDKMIDLTSEESRTYHYKDGSYEIDLPVAVFITPSGSHRVIDSEGVTHRPTPGYLAISWEPKVDYAAYVA